MEVDKIDGSEQADEVTDTSSEELEDGDKRLLLDLDQKRYLVLIIVSLATVIAELGLLTIINRRRADPDSRNNGAFYYVFFRQMPKLMYAVLYIPSAFIIEKYGVNISVTIGMAFCTLAMWAVFESEFTIAQALISFSMPFIVNCSTTVSARWFGPRGRNMATGILLLSFYLPVAVEVPMGEGFELSLSLILPIISTIWTVVSYALIYNKPDFCPTISEEDKVEIRKRNPDQLSF